MDGSPKATLGEESGSEGDQDSDKVQEILSHLNEGPVIENVQRPGRSAKRHVQEQP